MSVTTEDYRTHQRRHASATELHGLVIHPDGGHGVADPGQLHPAHLHPLVTLPGQHLISKATIIAT